MDPPARRPARELQTERPKRAAVGVGHNAFGCRLEPDFSQRMKTFAAPEPVAIDMSRLTSTSIGVEKGLVYDQDAGYYVLMSSEIAKIKVLKYKPLGLRKLLAIGLMATAALALLGGMLFTLMGGGGDLTKPATHFPPSP